MIPKDYDVDIVLAAIVLGRFKYEQRNNKHIEAMNELAVRVLYTVSTALKVVPRCHTRTMALDRLLEAHLLFQHAITHNEPAIRTYAKRKNESVQESSTDGEVPGTPEAGQDNEAGVPEA